MLRINLLNSVTERQGGAVASVDRQIASPSSRLMVMFLATLLLTAAVIGWDVISSSMANSKAQADLEDQKRQAAELQAVVNEQKDLEQKIQNIDARIEAIKTLRANQAGPSAVLSAVTERAAMVPGLYLESVEQAGDQMVFKGNSPDEQQVTQFGRSLEFSNGLFSNLSIETARNEVVNQNVVMKETSSPDANKVSIVNFTIKCAYTPSKAAGANANGATTASAQPQAPAAPTQVAKN
ncbi:MAG TPA: PilN domain-containing protein [Pyrinomonadaceae bacterium]|nr:PilN domain-containing protein [Pyrinomonadaceae bacterium]